jgi:hypothetical protein
MHFASRQVAEQCGANPLIVSYNASAVKICNTMSSLLRFGIKK